MRASFALLLAAGCIPPLPVERISDAGTATSTRAIGLAAGDGFACIVRADGRVGCWGKNHLGQTGAAASIDDERYTSADSHTWPWRRFTVLPGLEDVEELAAGATSMCARKRSGEVLCWGENEYGQLGHPGSLDAACFDPLLDKYRDCNPAPTVVRGIEGRAIQLVSGGSHACALTEAHRLHCWGLNYEGQVGIGTYGELDYVYTATTVRGLGADVVTVGAGLLHTCATLSGGALWCWGRNDLGQLAHAPASDPDCNGSLLRCNPTPQRAREDAFGAFIDGVEAMQGGERSSCALRSDGVVWCWGTNSRGDRGIGTFDRLARPNHFPTPIEGLPVIRQIASTWIGLLALDEDGGMWSWGYNADGQLGLGTTGGEGCFENQICRTTPEQIPGVPPMARVVVGYGSKYAIDETGRVWGWGQTGTGALARPVGPVDLGTCRSLQGMVVPCTPVPEILDLSVD